MIDRAGERFERLVEIMRALRAPDGCPWDREQTLASLRPFVLEETYEVLEAIEQRHARRTCARSSATSCSRRCSSRRSARKPATSRSATPSTRSATSWCGGIRTSSSAQHGDPALTSGQVIEQWETLKARERAGGRTSRRRRKTTLSGVPKTLPALLRAYEISARAAAVGFDWARPATCSTRSTKRSPRCGARSSPARPATCRAPRRRWATCSSRSPTCRASSASSPRRRCGAPTTSSRRGSTRWSARSPRAGSSLSEATLDEMEAEWQRVKKQQIATNTRRPRSSHEGHERSRPRRARRLTLDLGYVRHTTTRRMPSCRTSAR